MNGLLTVILGAALFCFMLYRQCMRRPVTRGDLLIPAIGALYLGTRYLGGVSLRVQDAVTVLVGTLIGIGTGLLCGQMIRVWRDQESGIVYQFGGWPYAVAFLSLLLVRIAMRVVARQWDFGASAAVLNDAFIGIIVGNFLGRAVNVGIRALALLDWQYDALPNTRRVRRARRYS
jgi:hypothetical protein